MTEAKWLTSADPEAMLRFARGTASGRKLRLFACACCRRIWHLLTDPRSRHAVEVAEQFADGKANRARLGAAGDFASHVMMDAVARGGDKCNPAWDAASAAFGVTDDYPDGADWHVCNAVGHAPDAGAAARSAEKRAQAALVQDLFGNPFRPARIEPEWLTWNRGVVTTMARGIYEDRAFECLPVLADALEEAGCANLDVLNHCRGPGPHVRGCWVIDLLLGKE